MLVRGGVKVELSLMRAEVIERRLILTLVSDSTLEHTLGQPTPPHLPVQLAFKPKTSDADTSRLIGQKSLQPRSMSPN